MRRHLSPLLLLFMAVCVLASPARAERLAVLELPEGDAPTKVLEQLSDALRSGALPPSRRPLRSASPQACKSR